MITKRLHIPHQITEFDQAMLVPLNRNMWEIQRHVAMTQARVETLESQMTEVLLTLGAIEETLEEIIEILEAP